MPTRDAGAGELHLRSGLSMPMFAERLKKLGSATGGEALANPETLCRALASSHHFRRDTRLGRIFHRRQVSFREVAPRHSLHVVFDGSIVSAHVDRVSPLNLDPSKRGHYSPLRALAHNLISIGEHLAQVASGRPRRHIRPFPVSAGELA